MEIGTSYGLARAQEGGGGAEYSDIFHIYVGSDHMLAFKILNVSILGGGGGGSEKSIIWGYDILWIFLGSHYKTELVLGIISMHFRVFS